ncbi:hypothetical protein [Acidipropionibacterium virtanenii]|uniref:DUF4352 domain-containing protein n=1 Tax=Acidipropionibacterium virtanenii TaxID=2057246 RepID=A0A344UPS9_9ACTN|nr:hypothetical protein [Acidipropionibacterium virtanenii]AXE37277.1 hypothetical protein JS278_00079 [Acidipropionibacterium virtanenii]
MIQPGRIAGRAVAATVTAVSLAIAGCESTSGTATPTPTPSTTASAGFTTADWATSVATSGHRLGVVGDKRVRITVYQVATAPAPTASVMVDPTDGTPVIAKGDRLVVLRYVVTNISTDPISLGIGTVAITARYPDWPWEPGLVGVRAPELMATDKAPTTPFKAGTQRPPYVLEPGASFMVGQNAPYETAEELQLDAKVVVSDDSGSDDASLSWSVKGSVHLR